MVDIAQVIRTAGDDLYLRHLLFIRFILGEPLRDAAPMALMAANAGWELPLHKMRHVAHNWNEEFVDG